MKFFNIRFATIYLNFMMLLLCMSIFFACNKTSEKADRWYRGNLHAHSYWSDGDEFPEMIMDWYKSNGYHFVVLSDHNILAQDEKWKLIPKGFIYKKAFDKYLEKYGHDWVEYREDTGRISVKLKTFSEYKPLFEEKNQFLIIQSEEITDSFDGKPLHLNATNVREFIEPQGGGSVVEVLQNNIDAVIKQKEETGNPMIVHINHPNFYYAVSLQDMIELERERFFEVFNGHPKVNNYGDSIHIGTEEMWDLINIAYVKSGKPLIYGIATDDSHNYHLFGIEYSNAGRGWIMVQADSLTSGSLITAMGKGRFYATTGVTLTQINFKTNVLEIHVDTEPGVEYEIQFIGVENGKQDSDILITETGAVATYTLSEDLLFVRAKIISSKLKENPYQEDDFEVAWTQPVIYSEKE